MLKFFKSKAQKEEEAEQKRIQFEQERLLAEQERRKEQECKQHLKENYEAERRKYGYTKGHSGIVTIKAKKFYAFIHEDHLKFFICQPPNWTYEGKKMPQWQRQSIAIQNIRYFTKEGQVYTETKISGGGSKGSSVSGAIIGATIAGTPGAIIASRSKTDPIHTTTIKHDSRKTVLIYNKGQIEFAPDDFNVLMRLIPDKEFSSVQHARAMAKVEQNDSHSSANKLRELKSLFDEGLITQDEYDQKKAEILGRL